MMQALLALIGALIVVGHILVAPFSKVEESFTLHAIHDFIYNPLPVNNETLQLYDHIANPGPVPRSFVGPAFIGLLLKPFPSLFTSLENDPLQMQIAVRVFLGLVNLTAFVYFVTKLPPSPRLRVSFMILSLIQFHVPFWMSRTIPNMLALPIVLFGLAQCALPLSSRPSFGLGLIGFCAIVFRIELAALFLPLAVQLLFLRKVSFFGLIKTGITSALTALLVSVPLDSYMWSQFPLCPEVSSFIFNVVNGQSAEWGVLPYYTYFTAFLPKLLLLSYPIATLGFTIDGSIRTFLFPAMVYVGLISLLGHKEWRFIVYVVPLFNVAALSTIDKIFARMRLVRHFVFLLLAGSTICATAYMTYVSANNYPGGYAMTKLHNELFPAPQQDIPKNVHIDAYSAMTGASLFTHKYDVNTGYGTWTYNKSETLDFTKPSHYQAFDILVTSDPKFELSNDFKVLGSVPAFAGFKPKPIGVPDDSLLPYVPPYLSAYIPLEMVLEDKVWILGRKEKKQQQQHRPEQ